MTDVRAWLRTMFRRSCQRACGDVRGSSSIAVVRTDCPVKDRSTTWRLMASRPLLRDAARSAVLYVRPTAGRPGSPCSQALVTVHVRDTSRRSPFGDMLRASQGRPRYAARPTISSAVPMNGRIVIGGLFVWQIMEVAMREVVNKIAKAIAVACFAGAATTTHSAAQDPNRRSRHTPGRVGR